MTDRQLIRQALAFRKGILGRGCSTLMCAAVCYPLQGYLSMIGVETTLVTQDFGWCNHVWLELADGRILDPTADQFRTLMPELPPVYLGLVPTQYLTWMQEASEEARKQDPLARARAAGLIDKSL